MVESQSWFGAALTQNHIKDPSNAQNDLEKNILMAKASLFSMTVSQNTRYAVKAHLDRRIGAVSGMDWPPQSLNLNLNMTEAVRDHLHRVQISGPKKSFWKHLQESRKTIPEEYLKKLLERVPKQIEAVRTRKSASYQISNFKFVRNVETLAVLLCLHIFKIDC